MNVMSLVAMLADHWKKAGAGDNVGTEYPAAYRVPSFPRRQAIKYLKLLGDQSLQNFSLDEAPPCSPPLLTLLYGIRYVWVGVEVTRRGAQDRRDHTRARRRARAAPAADCSEALPEG